MDQGNTGHVLWAEVTVRVIGTMSGCFKLKMGLKHDCVKSPWLFNILIGEKLCETKAKPLGKGVLNYKGRNWEIFVH